MFIYTKPMSFSTSTHYVYITWFQNVKEYSVSEK